MKGDVKFEKKYKKIVKQRYNEDFDEQFKKRLENNNLTMDDVKKKVFL